MQCLFMRNACFLGDGVFCGLEQGCLIGGLRDLLTFSPSCWSSVTLLPQQSTHLYNSESAGLRAISSSLSSVHMLASSRLLSPFLQLHRIHIMPVQHSGSAAACTNTLPSSALPWSHPCA